MSTIEDVIARFRTSYTPLMEANDEKRHFHAVYMRNTIAVREDLERGGFLDPDWVEGWDVVFADLYLEALDRWTRGESPSGPWQVAFEAAKDRDISPLHHVLVGLNAHLNYDLPQALLAVVSDEELQNRELVRRRYRDFKHIDDIVVRRVKEEDLELREVEEPGDRTLVDRMLTPFNRMASKRFLKEARRKVWHNALELAKARRLGSEQYATRLKQLEELSRAKVEDLLRPGKVLLRLAVTGYGVVLPPPSVAALGNPNGWPEELLALFDRFLTVEYATVNRKGTPVTYPATPYVGEAGRTLDVSCGLTSPAKAERARRNPKVCLLYANATGSGVEDPPVVLVYGTAAVRDRDLQANTDRYVRASLAKLPAPWKRTPRWMMRRLDWYWSRIWILVTPTRILWWSGGRLDEPPREWRAPEGTELLASDPKPMGPQPPPWRAPEADWRARAGRVGRDFAPPVLTVVDGEGFPVPFRTSACRFAGREFRLEVPAGHPADSRGPACLTFQYHEPDFNGYENAVFVGRAVPEGDEVVFRVERALPDISLTGSRLDRVRRFASSRRLVKPRVRTEAARRGQPPPVIRIPRDR